MNPADIWQIVIPAVNFTLLIIILIIKTKDSALLSVKKDISEIRYDVSEMKVAIGKIEQKLKDLPCSNCDRK